MIDYSALLSPAAKSIKPSGIRRFFDLAASMDDVITLGVGEPDYMTPWSIRQAGIEALERGHTWYTANAGLPELQREICRYLTRFDLHYETNEVMVTVGGSEAIDLTIRAFVSPGDEVLLPQPSFVAYEPIARLCGGVPVILETAKEDNFCLTPETLRKAITPKTKLLVFPFPSNPTGAVMGRDELEAIAEVLRGTNIIVLSDEIYAELTYEGKHISIASLPGMRERTVIVNGFSKAYAMTGWRLGYAAAPQPIMEVLLKIHQFAIMSAPTTSQYAAIEALRNCDDQIKEMRDDYRQRRQFIVAGLNRIGLPCFMPGGAFYAFPSIESTGFSSQEFCEKLLERKKVAVIPGDAFGESGEGFIRISYSYSVAHIKEALGRMEEFLGEL